MSHHVTSLLETLLQHHLPLVVKPRVLSCVMSPPALTCCSVPSATQPPSSSWNTPGRILPHGLCTCCFLRLKSPSQAATYFPLILVRPLFKCLLLRGALPGGPDTARSLTSGPTQFTSPFPALHLPLPGQRFSLLFFFSCGLFIFIQWKVRPVRAGIVLEEPRAPGKGGLRSWTQTERGSNPSCAVCSSAPGNGP